ncbi:MAG: Mur ligase family protein [Alphaproteobacteria bacterium]|nr:Mur ligase family protein [Alphaproteobacteria bacterium]
MLQPTSATILERIRLAHGKDIDLTLRDTYAKLLTSLGSPQNHLPPTIVVAGTNGKGSTCAFLRAIIEAEGKTAHVFTSPHLVDYYERIRITGQLITETELTDLLLEAEARAQAGGVSLFEIGAAVALAAFARNKADITILEVGLGGRLDATNVVPRPVATVISRLSFDHRNYLGNTMAEIAREKAGIMRAGVPCFVTAQPSSEAQATLRQESMRIGAPLSVGDSDWRIEAQPNGTYTFISPTRTITDLPRPALVGAHQLCNAGLAIAASAALPFPLSDEAIRQAMTTVSWPGRLQHLTHGPLVDLLPQGCELWLDGGHNDSAGEALAAQMQTWQVQDHLPLNIIYGMLSTKKPEEFLTPIAPYIHQARTLTIRGEVPGFTAEALTDHVRTASIKNVAACTSIQDAIQELSHSSTTPSRTLICGSLVLVGEAIRMNVSRST